MNKKLKLLTIPPLVLARSECLILEIIALNSSEIIFIFLISKQFDYVALTV